MEQFNINSAHWCFLIQCHWTHSGCCMESRLSYDSYCWFWWWTPHCCLCLGKDGWSQFHWGQETVRSDEVCRQGPRRYCFQYLSQSAHSSIAFLVVSLSLRALLTIVSLCSAYIFSSWTFWQYWRYRKVTTIFINLTFQHRRTIWLISLIKFTIWLIRRTFCLII